MSEHHTWRRIALLLWTTGEVPRRAILGVRNYAAKQGNWELVLRAPNRTGVEELEGYDGVIAFLPHRPPLVDAVHAQGIRTINLSGADKGGPLPRVLPDDVAAGRMAAEHLIERGAASLVGLAIGDIAYAGRRLQGFLDCGRNAGVPTKQSEVLDARTLQSEVGARPPVGVYAPNDGRALRIVRSSLHAGIKVPDELAVVGTDNTELLCEMSAVPLSSVDLDAEQIGRRAAGLLHEWITSGRRPPPVTIVPPKGVYARASTDLLPGADPGIAQAIRFLRQVACTGMSISQFAARAGLSRRALERACRQVLGHSPHDEMTRVRMSRARQLLVATDSPVSEVARRCGFASSKHFARRFRECTGQSPREWRTKGSG